MTLDPAPSHATYRGPEALDCGAANHSQSSKRNPRSAIPCLLLRSAVRRWLRTPSADYPAVVDLAFQRRWGTRRGV